MRNVNEKDDKRPRIAGYASLNSWKDLIEEESTFFFSSRRRHTG